MSRRTEIPYYALLASYAEAKAMNTAQRLRHVVRDIATHEVSQSFVDGLANDFALSVLQLGEHYAGEDRIGDALNGKDSGPGKCPSLRATHPATSRKVAHAAFEHGGIEVPSDPALTTQYLGFELSPLRSPGGARFVAAAGTALPPGMPRRAGNAVRIDLVGRTTAGTPVVQEVKVAGDSDPPIALLQALAYTAALCPGPQYARLRAHYPDVPDVATPRFDIQIVVAGKIPSARSTRRPLWHVMPDLIARLSARDEIAAHVGRISGVRVDPAWREGEITATPVNWASPD
jgi:methylmalonyl-CoA mutase cobalamin-binding subunit